MERNKEQTKDKLLEAVRAIIRKEGFQNIGVNKVAKEAGVDKVLIYRYFGNLEGLLKELGLYTVKIQLHQDITADLKVWVVPMTAEEEAR